MHLSNELLSYVIQSPQFNTYCVTKSNMKGSNSSKPHLHTPRPHLAGTLVEQIALLVIIKNLKDSERHTLIRDQQNNQQIQGWKTFEKIQYPYGNRRFGD